MYVYVISLIRELLDNNGFEEMSIDSYLETVRLYGVNVYKKTDEDSLRERVFISSGDVDLFLWSYDRLDYESEEYYLKKAQILSSYLDDSIIQLSELKESIDSLQVNLPNAIKEAGFEEDHRSKDRNMHTFYNDKLLPQFKIQVDNKYVEIGFSSVTLSFAISIGNNNIPGLENSFKAITESYNSESEFKWELNWKPLLSEKVKRLEDGGYFEIHTTYRQYSISDLTIIREILEQCMFESEELFNKLLSLIIE